MIDHFTKTVRLGAAAMFCTGVAGLLSGCSRSTQESQVSGQVLLDGNRIGPGTVVFAPVGNGKPAIGAVDPDGDYRMNTSREVGLGAGKYKVAVSIREVAGNIKRGDRPPPGKLLIPEKYEDTATSGLEYDVVPGHNTINIELKSQSNSTAIFETGSTLSQGGPMTISRGDINVIGQTSSSTRANNLT